MQVLQSVNEYTEQIGILLFFAGAGFAIWKRISKKAI